MTVGTSASTIKKTKNAEDADDDAHDRGSPPVGLLDKRPVGLFDNRTDADTHLELLKLLEDDSPGGAPPDGCLWLAHGHPLRDLGNESKIVSASSKDATRPTDSELEAMLK